MRALVVALVICVAAPASAREKPARPRCDGPSTWEAVQACLRDFFNVHEVVELSPHLRAVTDEGVPDTGRVYVQELDGRWRFVRMFTPAMRVVDDRVENKVLRRVELREIIELGEHREMRVKIAIVCTPGTAGRCTAYQYDCVQLARGRAVGVIKGEIAFDAGVATIVADRSRAGEQCQ